MRIVFCGTPEFAVPCLKHFLTLKDFEVAAVFIEKREGFGPTFDRTWFAPARTCGDFVSGQD